MTNLLKYIIILHYLSDVFTTEDAETIQCMANILRQAVENEKECEKDTYIQNLIEEFGEYKTIKAVNLLAEMYRRITKKETYANN